MENVQSNNIYKYLLVAFFAVFIGTGLFLLVSDRSKTSGEKISTARVDFPEEDTADIPAEEPTTANNTTDTVTPDDADITVSDTDAATADSSMTLETDLPGGQMKVGDMFELSLFADSNGKNIVGYDVVIFYDSLAFDFLRGLSSLSDYNIFTYKKGHYFTITGLKTLQSAPSPMTKANKIATLTFQSTKTGKFEFSLKPSNDKDKTDLITDKTEVLIPALDQLTVDVK